MSSTFNIKEMRQNGLDNDQILSTIKMRFEDIAVSKNYNDLCSFCEQVAWAVRNNDPLAFELLPFVKGFKGYDKATARHHGNCLIYVAGAKPDLLQAHLETVDFSIEKLQKLATVLLVRKDWPALMVVMTKINQKRNKKRSKLRCVDRKNLTVKSYKEVLLTNLVK